MGRFILDQSQITFLPSNNRTESGTQNISQSETGRPIYLANHTLYFQQNCQKLHPDLLALICLIVFYPYLKNDSQLIFPQNVSSQFVEILNLHNIKPDYVNVDPNVKPRKQPKSYKTCLSWGGGFDTWTAYYLQPELYHITIHQKVPESPVPDPSKQDSSKFKAKHIVIDTNCRSISYEDNLTKRSADKQSSTKKSGASLGANDLHKDLAAGWVTWPQVLIGCIWLADDYDLGMIAMGGNLGSVYLRDGQQYYPAHLKPNLWSKTFEMVGLPFYLPLAGLTDLAVTKILIANKPDWGLVKYCSVSVDESNCHQCPKCLRKELLLGRDLHIPLEQGGPSLDYLQRGEQADWVFKYYQPAFELLSDQDLRTDLKAALEKYVEMLPREEEYQVEHYGWVI